MEDKIEIGEYVRFKNGKIRKIIGIDKDNHYCVDINYNGAKYLTVFEVATIIKHSSNIIDLIEVGDYVNGEKVEEIFEDGLIYYHAIRLQTNKNDFLEQDIISIATKEQFENIEYRLRDEYGD